MGELANQYDQNPSDPDSSGPSDPNNSSGSSLSSAGYGSNTSSGYFSDLSGNSNSTLDRPNGIDNDNNPSSRSITPPSSPVSVDVGQLDSTYTPPSHRPSSDSPTDDISSGSGRGGEKIDSDDGEEENGQESGENTIKEPVGAGDTNTHDETSDTRSSTSSSRSSSNNTDRFSGEGQGVSSQSDSSESEEQQKNSEDEVVNGQESGKSNTTNEEPVEAGDTNTRDHSSGGSSSSSSSSTDRSSGGSGRGVSSGSSNGSSRSGEQQKNSDNGDDQGDHDDNDDHEDEDDGGKQVKVRKGVRCTYCNKSLPNEERLLIHLTRFHLRRQYECQTCGKVFGRADNLKRHQLNHKKNEHVPCPICGKMFARKDCLLMHVRNVHKKRKQTPPKANKSKRSRKQDNHDSSGGSSSSSSSSSDQDEDNDNRMQPTGKASGAGDQGDTNGGVSVDDGDRQDGNDISQDDDAGEDGGDVHEDENEIPQDDMQVLQEDPEEMPQPEAEDSSEEDDDDDDDDVEDNDQVLYDNLYRANWSSIRTHHRVGRRVQDIYNFRIGSGRDQVGGGGSMVERRLRAIFNRQRFAFKINMSYGYVLRNYETGELRYFHSSLNNHRYLEVPHLIANRDDLNEFIRIVSEASAADYAIRQRPNTKWTVVGVTNVTFYVYKLSFNIGAGNQELPAYVMNNRAVHALIKNRKTGRPYKDNLCFFRCLAMHRGCTPANLERDAKYYFEKYLEIRPQQGAFQGVTLEDIPVLEKLFETNVQVFSLEEQRSRDSENEDDDDNEDDSDGDNGSNSSDNDDRHTDRNNPQVCAELVWRTRSKFSTTMHLNLYSNHFSFIKDLQMYSKSYRCSRCDRLFDKSYRLKRHELTCDGNVTHKFPGGPYRTPPTVFQRLENEGIETPEELLYFHHRATFDFECYFDEGEAASHQTTSKFKVAARHIPLSVSVASNVQEYEETKHFITNGNSSQLVQSLVEYLDEVSRASYEQLYPDYAPLFEALDDKISSLELHPMLDKKTKNKRRRQLERLRENLDDYIFTLPVIGFNSGKYDLNLIREYLYPAVLKNCSFKYIIKRGSSYPCLQTENLKFLDISNYLAPGYSYRNFLKAYGAEAGKGFFPYEWLTSLDKLDHPSLPPHEAFFSKLTNSNISYEEYHYCQEIWQQHNMTTMRDFLQWYNDLDVAPFLVAIDNMFAFYQSLGIDMFKDAISVPGLTLKYLFSTLNPDTFFTLFKDKDKDLYYKMRQNIVGGPSVIFHRYHEKDKTTIRKGSKLCNEVVGFDANALYLWALMQSMPTGVYVRRSDETNFRPTHAYYHGETAVQWLDWLAETEQISIQHQFNMGEKKVGHRQIPVDGYCASNNTVYQFHGCYFHGHNCALNPGTWNHTKRCSMADLRQQTQQISSYIRAEGYNLVEMYECTWQRLKRTDQDVAAFVDGHRSPLHQCRSMNLQTIIDAVRDERLFGVIECDIEVPSHLKDYFSEMPPIFKNCIVSKEDIGPHMRDFSDENGLMSQPRRTLIGSLRGDKIMLITPLVKWYLDHGLQITKVYEVIEYQPKSCFTEFGKKVVDARRAGDVDPHQAIVAETMKLIGNSAYGKTITNKEKFTNVSTCLDSEAPRKINSPHFRHLTLVGEDVCELEMSKTSITMDLPIQIGFFVYGYAKLRMLSFYYDLVDRYISREDFQYCAMDTDSAYIALSGPWHSLIKDEKKEEFEEIKDQWFPRTDTEDHIKYDRREPGLFKEEWSGDGIVALCSKTYYCFGAKDKFSCKGLNKRQRRPITAQRYLDVLSSKTSGSGVNRGFRLLNGTMVTYSQEKNALPYLYIKRKVDEDGVSTSPLDL